MTFLSIKLEGIYGSLIGARMHQIQVINEIRFLFLFLKLVLLHTPHPKKKVKGGKLGRGTETENKKKCKHSWIMGSTLSRYFRVTVMMSCVLSITKYVKSGGFLVWE